MKYFLLFALTILLSSCLEIIEEVNLNDNGSGKLSYTINLSQSKTKINSVMLLDSINGQKIPTESDIRLKINEGLAVLAKNEGISGITKTLDFDNYIFKFSCDFSSPTALNNASTFIKDYYKIKDPYANKDDHFTYNSSQKTFRRKGDYSGQADLEKVRDEDLEMMKDAMLTTIYRFDSEVVSASNKDAKISPNRKAVMLKYPIMDLVNQSKKIENTITLK